jgi:hypothetical protein
VSGREVGGGESQWIDENSESAIEKTGGDALRDGVRTQSRSKYLYQLKFDRG